MFGHIYSCAYCCTQVCDASRRKAFSARAFANSVPVTVHKEEIRHFVCKERLNRSRIERSNAPSQKQVWSRGRGGPDRRAGFDRRDWSKMRGGSSRRDGSNKRDGSNRNVHARTRAIVQRSRAAFLSLCEGAYRNLHTGTCAIVITFVRSVSVTACKMSRNLHARTRVIV